MTAVWKAKFALAQRCLHRARPCTGPWPDQAPGLLLGTGPGLRPACAPCTGPGLRPGLRLAHAPCTGPGLRPAQARAHEFKGVQIQGHTNSRVHKLPTQRCVNSRAHPHAINHANTETKTPTWAHKNSTGASMHGVTMRKDTKWVP